MVKTDSGLKTKRNTELGRDMTVGSIPAHLIAFATPMLLGNLLQALYNTVDTIWVGQFLGPDALAAVSVSFPIVFVLVSLVMGITMATTVLVAQSAGAKRMDVVRKVIGNSISLLALSGTFVSVLGVVFHKRILQLVNVPLEIQPMASQYISVFLGGLLSMFMYNVLGAIMRGLGDSRSPLLFLFYATIMNIILDPLMIFGIWPFPRMGVRGAALATVVSQAFSCVLAVRYLLKKTELLSRDRRDYTISKDLTLKTVSIGLPVGVQQTIVSLGMLIVSSVINSFGGTVVAGFGAGARLDQFSVMPAMSIGMAVSSMVGQNIGAEKPERVKEIVKWSVGISALLAGLLMLVALLVPEPILSLFTRAPEVLKAGSEYVRIIAFSFVPLAVMFAVNGVMRGAGDTFPNMLISVTTLWLVRVPLARYLSAMPNLQHRGIWWAMVVSSMLSMILSVAYYSTGRWRKRSLVAAKSPELTKMMEELAE